MSMLDLDQLRLGKKSYARGEKSIIQFSCMSSRNHNQRFVDYSPGRARKRSGRRVNRLKGTCGRSQRQRELYEMTMLVFDPLKSSDSFRVVCFFKALWTRYLTYTGRGGNHRQEPSGRSGWPRSHQPVKYISIRRHLRQRSWCDADLDLFLGDLFLA